MSQNTTAADSISFSQESDPCARLYRRKSPPVPREQSVYSQAKAAEYAGDLESAMCLYLEAISRDDRRDSAVKDYGGLLHMLGRTDEALAFLEMHSPHPPNASFMNLIEQLRMTQCKPLASLALPRTLLVELPESEVVDSSTLARLFPNPSKIGGFAVHGLPNRGVVEFVTHSSARKALNVPKVGNVRCAWAPPGPLKESDWELVFGRKLETHRPLYLDQINLEQPNFTMQTPSPARLFSGMF